MGLFDRVYKDLIIRKKRILEGKLNCIPSSFPRFRKVFPGVEQRKYILFSANSKVGKTQIADDMCLYEPLFYAVEHNELKIHWFYFTWELSAEQKLQQFLCHLLYRLSDNDVRIDTKQLRSIDAERLLSDEVLELLKEEKYQKYIKYFEENVTFIEDIRNPTGIKKFLEDYAQNTGTIHRITKKFYDKTGAIADTKEVFDYYQPDDPELYNIVIFDHISLISTENGMDLRNTIGMFSNKFLVQLRNRYGFTFVVVQQQAASQESNENLKLDKLRPTADGLADCKTTFRDADLFFGLYAPYRYKISEYLGYDIKKFQDNIRFLELVGGREGGEGNVCPLYFDGAVNFFKELPHPRDEGNIARVYVKLDAIRGIKNLVALAIKTHVLKEFSNGNSRRNFWFFWRRKNNKHDH